MVKVKRKKVVLQARSYNFDTIYQEEMSYFDDKKVISVCLVSTKEEHDLVREEYLVFYEDENKDRG